MWQHKDMHGVLKRSGQYKEEDYIGPLRAMGGAMSTTTLRRPISTQGPERPLAAMASAPSRIRPDLPGTRVTVCTSVSVNRSALSKLWSYSTQTPC